MLRAELGAERELRRRLELKIAELERRLGSDSTTSGTPPSKDPIGAQSAARRGGRPASPRNGSGARTASAAGSPAIPARGCRGTWTRTGG